MKKEMKAKIEDYRHGLVFAGLLLFVALQPVKAGFNCEDYKAWIKQKGYYYCHRSEDYPKVISRDKAYTLTVCFNYVMYDDLGSPRFKYFLRSGYVEGSIYAALTPLPEEANLTFKIPSAIEWGHLMYEPAGFFEEGKEIHEILGKDITQGATFIDVETRHNTQNNTTYYSFYNFLRDVHAVVGIYFESPFRGNIGQSYARGCHNLKIISFGDVYYYSKDILLDCPNLETVRFTKRLHPNATSLLHIFNTYYDRTGTYYYPKLTTFVVPDEHYDAYVTEIHKATSLVRDGLLADNQQKNNIYQNENKN